MEAREHDLEAAERDLRKAVELVEQAGAGDVDHSAMVAELADVLLERDEVAEGCRLLAGEAERVEARLGSAHPQVAVLLARLAECRDRQGSTDEAVQLYDRAYAITVRAVGPAHQNVLAMLANAAATLGRACRYEEAQRYTERLLAAASKHASAAHGNTFTIYMNTAVLAVRLERPGAVADNARLALASLERAGGLGGTEEALADLLLARGLAQSGADPDEAYALLDHATAILEDPGRSEPGLDAEVHFVRGLLLQSGEDWRGAATELATAWTIDSADESDWTSLAELQLQLAVTLRDHDPATAAAWAERAARLIPPDCDPPDLRHLQARIAGPVIVQYR